jgi:hypothetical protein
MNLKNLIKVSLHAKGGDDYVFLIPVIEGLIKDKVEKKVRQLEASVIDMITDSLLTRAFEIHAAQHNDSNKKGNNENDSKE